MTSMGQIQIANAPEPETPPETPSRQQGTKRPASPETCPECCPAAQARKLTTQGKYQPAIDCLTTEIQNQLDLGAIPDRSLYADRALAQLRLGRYPEAVADCRTALLQNPGLLKAHQTLGEALCELGSLDEGLTHFEIALIIGQENGSGIGEVREIAKIWRKRQSLVKEKQVADQDLDQMAYIIGLIRRDESQQISALLGVDLTGNQVENPAIPLPDSELESKIAAVTAQGDKCVSLLNRMSAVMEDKRKKSYQVPEQLCGKISLELMRDPVITPSGISYERGSIEEHLKMVGAFEPCTRAPLTKEQLVPNLALKEVIDAFVKENDWAREF